jgi:hypothetical protein
MSRTYRGTPKDGKRTTNKAVIIDCRDGVRGTVTVPDGFTRTQLKGLEGSGVERFWDGEYLTKRERKTIKNTIRRVCRRKEKAVTALELRATEAELREEQARRNAENINEEMEKKVLMKYHLSLADSGKYAALMNAVKAHFDPKDMIGEARNYA